MFNSYLFLPQATEHFCFSKDFCLAWISRNLECLSCGSANLELGLGPVRTR